MEQGRADAARESLLRLWRSIYSSDEIDWRAVEKAASPDRPTGWLAARLRDDPVLSDDEWQVAQTSPALSGFAADLARLSNHFLVATDRQRQPKVADTSRYDVVAIGALNLDHIVLIDGEGQAVLEEVGDWLGDSVGETVLEDEDSVQRVIDLVQSRFVESPTDDSVLHALGGSSFNTLRTLADANRGLRLAFIGAQGNPVFPGMLTHRARLDRARVMTDFISTVPNVHIGRCVSVVQRTGRASAPRQMGVWPGANTQFANQAALAFWELVQLCRQSEYLHISSLFDPYSPALVADLVQMAGNDGKGPTISLDPGSRWLVGSAEVPDHDVVRILMGANIIFVNPTELGYLAAAIAQVDPNTAIDAAGREILQRLPKLQALVLKLASSVVIFRAGEPPLRVQSARALPRQVDDTGAGDAFAAGLLAELVARPTDWETACKRALDLAARSVQVEGPMRAADVRSAFRTKLR